MVHKCCVSACGMSVRSAGAKGLSYHVFPAKEPNRDRWIQAILPHVDKPESFRVVQGYTRVCSRHFKKKDYSIDSKKRARLSSNAVPTVFPGKSSPISRPSKADLIKSKGTNSEILMNSIKQGEKETPCLCLTRTKDSLGAILTEMTGSIESATVDHEQPPLTLSEEDTASSKFSSQESLQIQMPEPNETDSGKIRKRRKNRNSLPRASTGPKKRSSSSTSEDLNVKVVGDALAEINLSALIAATSSDLRQELDNILNEQIRREETKSSVDNFYRNHQDGTSFLDPLSDFENTVSSASDNFPRSSIEIEHELLRSIQAVSLNCGEPESLPPVVTVSTDAAVDSNTDPAFSSPLTVHPAEMDELLSNHLHSLYDDLVNGGASLSLEESRLPSFDSQDLIEALRSATEGLELTTDIDQLARDLNPSILEGALPASILDLDGIRISHLDPNSFNFGRDLILSDISEVPNSSTLTDKVKEAEGDTSAGSEAPTQEVRVENVSPASTLPFVEEQSSSPTDDMKRVQNPVSDTNTESSSPERAGKKPGTKEKGSGSFSVERFRGCDKDIEYYTGFQTFCKFEVFYRSLDSYVENLKVTDMMHGVANLMAPSQPESGSPQAKKPPSETVTEEASPVHDELKRRVSQGRSMSRIDELFMTVIRLKRKIPEKVLGHMFCISQPTVSRIIRAWTMLLSRVLELLPPEKKLKKTESSKGASTSSSGDGISSNRNSLGNEKGQSNGLGIPQSFRQLFHSDLAQSIIASGAASNSRKTSSSTSCPNISRSKRPKKEKLVVVVTEEVVPSTPVTPKTASTQSSDQDGTPAGDDVLPNSGITSNSNE